MCAANAILLLTGFLLLLVVGFFFLNLLSAETLSAESQPKARFLQSSFKSLDVSVFVMEMLT